MTEPKIVTLDIETLPNLQAALEYWPQLSDYPGKTLKASLNSVLCIGYQIYGEDKPRLLASWEQKTWNKNVNDDSIILKQFHEIVKDADAIITQNGKRFDWPFLQTRFHAHGLPFIGKINHIDLKEVVKSNLSLINNRLGTIAKTLINDDKMDHEGWDLWVKAYNRDQAALNKMGKYCLKDVLLTTKCFVALRPFVSNIPNQNLWLKSHTEMVCPACGSTRLKNNGWRHTQTKTYQRLMCLDCNTWARLDAKNRNPRPL